MRQSQQQPQQLSQLRQQHGNRSPSHTHRNGPSHPGVRGKTGPIPAGAASRSGAPIFLELLSNPVSDDGLLSLSIDSDAAAAAASDDDKSYSSSSLANTNEGHTPKRTPAFSTATPRTSTCRRHGSSSNMIESQIQERDHDREVARLRKALATVRFDKVRQAYRLKTNSPLESLTTAGRFLAFVAPSENASSSGRAGGSGSSQKDASIQAPLAPPVTIVQTAKTAVPVASPPSTHDSGSTTAEVPPKLQSPPVEQAPKTTPAAITSTNSQPRSSATTLVNEHNATNTDPATDISPKNTDGAHRLTKEQQRRVFVSLKTRIRTLETALADSRTAAHKHASNSNSQIQALQEIIASKGLRLRAEKLLARQESNTTVRSNASSTASHNPDRSMAGLLTSQVPSQSVQPPQTPDAIATTIEMLSMHIDKQANEIASLRSRLNVPNSHKNASTQTGVSLKDAQTSEDSNANIRAKLERLMTLLADLTTTMLDSLEETNQIIPTPSGQLAWASDSLGPSNKHDTADRVETITFGLERLRNIVETLTTQCRTLLQERTRLQNDYETGVVVVEDMRVQAHSVAETIHELQDRVRTLDAEIAQKHVTAEHAEKWLRSREAHVEAELSRLADKKVRVLVATSSMPDEDIDVERSRNVGRNSWSNTG